MTPKEAAFFRRVRRRAAQLEPALRRAYLAGFEELRSALSVADMARLIESGQAERLVSERLDDATIREAFAELRKQATESVRIATEQMAREIPAGIRALAKDGIRFDYLNPRVIDAVRQLDDRMMRTLADGIREGAREIIQQGLERGINPRQVARTLSSTVGIAPNQAAAIQHYREALEAGNAAKALTYKLRDHRYDAATGKGELTREQIDKMVDAYSRRMHAFNADTNARSAALDAQRLGQRLSWEDAANKGIVDRTLLMKRWMAVGGPQGDGRNREEHLEMHGETVPFDGTYSNGDTYPGQGDFNCRCGEEVFEAKDTQRMADEVARNEARRAANQRAIEARKTAARAA